jgi:hypothetical protein
MTHIDKTYEWFTRATSEAHGSRDQALAWLETPNARVKAARISFRLGDPAVLLDRARAEFTKMELPTWGDPLTAQNWMADQLQRIFDSMESACDE